MPILLTPISAVTTRLTVFECISVKQIFDHQSSDHIPLRKYKQNKSGYAPYLRYFLYRVAFKLSKK